MLDINGQEFQEGDEVQVLCQVIAIDDEGVRVRILNSEQELLVSVSRDEVLGLHASPELTKFTPTAPCRISHAGTDFGNGAEDYDKSPAGIAERYAEMMLGQLP